MTLCRWDQARWSNYLTYRNWRSFNVGGVSVSIGFQMWIPSSYTGRWISRPPCYFPATPIVSCYGKQQCTMHYINTCQSNKAATFCFSSTISPYLDFQENDVCTIQWDIISSRCNFQRTSTWPWKHDVHASRTDPNWSIRTSFNSWLRGRSCFLSSIFWDYFQKRRSLTSAWLLWIKFTQNTSIP